MTLTASEQEVVECVAKGWGYSRISRWLGMQPSTARRHVANIAQKLTPQGDLKGYERVLYWACTSVDGAR